MRSAAGLTFPAPRHAGGRGRGRGCLASTLPVAATHTPRMGSAAFAARETNAADHPVHPRRLTAPPHRVAGLAIVSVIPSPNGNPYFASLPTRVLA